MSEHVRIPVDGMTCTSCVAHITKAVRRVGGVESVKVDLGSESATVGFDSAQTTLAAVADAIARAGYEPHLELVEFVAPAAPRGVFGWLRSRRSGERA